MPHVEGREAAAQRGIDGVHWLRQPRRLIDRLRIGLPGEQIESMRAMIRVSFQRAVVRVRNRPLQLHAAERGSESCSRRLLVEQPAPRNPDSDTAPDRPGLLLPAPAGDATKCPHSSPMPACLHRIAAPRWPSSAARTASHRCGSTAEFPPRLKLAPVHAGVRIGPARSVSNCCSGKRCPAFTPVAATVNGEANSGGAAQVYV